MNIHRVTENESLASIAEMYEISKDRLYENNTGLGLGLAEGRELLIMRPSRTYTAKKEDSIGSLSKRFSIKKHTLLMNNPSILNDGIVQGREYAIKYPAPPLGAAAANGYFFGGTSVSVLDNILPFLTYLTVSNCKIKDGSPVRLFSPSEAVRKSKDCGKVALMRVFDGEDGELFCDREYRKKLCEELVGIALADGFRGITLSSFKAAANFKEEFSEFLIDLRKSMIGCDLILFLETDETLSPEISELADGGVFMYSKHGLSPSPSFEDGERLTLSEFADKTESSKSMLYLPTDAFSEGNYIPYGKAFSHLSKNHKIVHDEKTGLCKISDRGHDFTLDSLENTKAKLELCAELGFMGVAFDIGSVPKEYLLMWSALFAPVHYQLPYSFPI